MRINEITENYVDKLQADVMNLLMSMLASGETEIPTDSLVKELNQLGYSVTPNSLADVVKNMKLVKSINQDKIVLQQDHNLTQYSKDATMDNEKTVSKLAKKTIDRDL
jgi:hypothetical protein